MKANALIYKFYIINTLYAILTLTFIGYKIYSGDADNLYYIGLVSVLIVLGFSFIVRLSPFYKNIKLQLVGLYLCVFLYGLTFFSDNPYIIAFGMLTHVIFVVEISLIVIAENYIQTRYTIWIYTVVITNIIARYIYVDEYNHIASAFFAFYIVILSSIQYIIAENFKESLSVIRTQNEQIINNDIAFTKLEKTNEDINRANAEMFIQNELVRYISTSIDIKQLMDLVTDSIIGAVGVDICSLIIQKSEDLRQRIDVKSNLKIDLKRELTKSLDTGEFDIFFKLKQTYVDENVDPTLYPFIKKRDTKSLIIIPLRYEEEVYGLLIAEKMNTGTINGISVEFFENIGRQVTIAIRNAKMYMVMRDMANRDHLSNLYNRRYMQETISKLVKKAIVNEIPISVALFDIDYFKKINDTYGHMFGDEVIKKLAELIMKLCKKYQFMACRYGGEEFLLVFDNRDIDEALPILKELHEVIKAERYIYKDIEEVHIDVSIGVSSFPKFALGLDELLNRADNAMYYSKENGRGRITVDNYELL